jgi:ADP-ribosyl-[dinitrogen reductase] hydrolase
MKRTSLTHPLQIAEVRAGDGFGYVGLTLCPGKRDRNAMTGSWDRDLAIDLDAAKAWGTGAVVTLVTEEELRLLGVRRLGNEVERRGMLWFHLPIIDASTPDATFEQQWNGSGEKLHELLRSGGKVLVHCRGGLGRAGTIAARLLIEFGWKPTDAIARVRAIRPGAIETLDQEKYIMTIAERTQG